MEAKRMSKDENYRRLIGSARWRELSRTLKTRAEWRCSQCGKITARLAVHHIRPVESAGSAIEMEALCFNRNNCQVLCYDCHASLHKVERLNLKKGETPGRMGALLDSFFKTFVNKKEEGAQ